MRIGIIGAGVTGLTAAWHLAKQGHQVTVLEARQEVGGLVAGTYLQREPIERIYHHIFTGDDHVLSLIKELGLSDQLVWKSPKSGLFIRSRLHPFSSPMHLLMFPELPFLQRVRLGLLVLRARFIRDWQSMESILAKDWLTRHAGREAYEVLWDPLIRSKFDTNADDISAVWIWNKFKLRGSTRGEASTAEAFGYLTGGFTQLYEKLMERLKDLSGEARFGVEVLRIEQTVRGTLRVETEQTQFEFDQVLFTGSPSQLLKICQFPTDSAYASQCANLRYKANLCLLLTLSASLSPYYWTTVADSSIPFVLVIEHTNLIPDHSYGGAVVYLSRYLDEADPLFTGSDEEVMASFLEGLKRMYPAFSPDWVRTALLTRERYAQPVVGLHYAKRMPSLQTPVPGLFLAGMAQIYPEDRGQNFAIRLAEKVVSSMTKSGC